MKQYIDIETWERKDNFNFFSGFINPCITVTSEVGCGAAKQRAHDRGESFFLHYLYAVLRAANEIKELRCRIDHQGRVVMFDRIDTITPIRVNDSGQFFTVRIPWLEDFDAFHRTAREVISAIPADGSPYAGESESVGDDHFNLILVSATPDLYFTSITHTQEHSNGADYPLLNVGKAVMRDGRLVIPIAVYVHHGLVDGVHIADFFARVERYLS